jgi:hypothetical protein
MAEDKIKRGYGGGLQAIDFSDVARQIEQAKKKNKLLKGSAIGLLVVSLLMGYILFNYFVGRYAEIENLQMVQNQKSPKWVDFKFKVKKSGIVQRGYENAINEDPVTTGENAHFWWSWYVDPSKKEFTVYTRSRWWIFPTWETKTFALSGKP